jgi:hypothetical protein
VGCKCWAYLAPQRISKICPEQSRHDAQGNHSQKLSKTSGRHQNVRLNCTDSPYGFIRKGKGENSQLVHQDSKRESSQLRLEVVDCDFFFLCRKRLTIKLLALSRHQLRAPPKKSGHRRRGGGSRDGGTYLFDRSHPKPHQKVARLGTSG